MSSLVIYNSLTKNKDRFKSITPGLVNMYVCGPTVYDYLHIGNFRGAIFFNLVRNFLEYSGYKVVFSYNYTDVDDKIINRANEKNISTEELSQFFIKAFEDDYKLLKLNPHTHNPKVSEYIPQMIDFVQTILSRGLAYELDGSVYLRRHKLAPIGKLSNRNIFKGLSGEKIIEVKKEHPSDFALWKAAKPGEVSWNSPWGAGRPGWHLECSVMIHELYRGKTLDIHGGGNDLLFPHHENEIHQCEAHSEHDLANFWMHNNMLDLGGTKMAKSVGNIITGHAFIQEHSAELLKFIMLSHHYRSVIDFSPEQIKHHKNQLSKIYALIKRASTNPKGQPQQMNDLKAKIVESLNDDFNTPAAFTHLYEAMNRFNKNEKLASSFLEIIQLFKDVANLFVEDPVAFSREIDLKDLKQLNISEENIVQQIALRKELRNSKNYIAADEIRTNLLKYGIELIDFSENTGWTIVR